MRLAVLLFCLLSAPLAAQDRAGNDTPGEWTVTHHKTFGLWDSMCDERRSGDRLEQRCYLRYVDVFSPRPEFGAIFAFVTPGPTVEFGFEPGTQFRQGGLHSTAAGVRNWTMPARPCMSGGTCRFEAEGGARLLDTFVQSDRLVFDFLAPNGTPQMRVWDLGPFAPALADHLAQSGARGL